MSVAEYNRTRALGVLILALFGVVLGSLLDGLHTHSGATEYTHPWIWKMAVWVPPLFGGASLAIGTTHADFDRRVGRAPRRFGWPSILLQIVLFSVTYWMSAYLPVSSATKLVLLLLAFAAIWAVFDRHWQGIVLAILTAIVGCGVEASLVAAGKFRYTQPDMLGVALWLPALYMNASVAVGNLGRKVLPGR